jgi:hypothetical protein
VKAVEIEASHVPPRSPATAWNAMRWRMSARAICLVRGEIGVLLGR